MSSCKSGGGPNGDNGFRPYGVRHAILQFQHEGNVRGAETLYIDSFGVNEARWIDIQVLTEHGVQVNHSYLIKHRSDSYVVDSARGVAVHFVDSLLDSLYSLSGSDVPTPEENAASLLSRIGVSKLGDTTILGINGELWGFKNMPGGMVQWRGVNLGRLSDMGGVRLVSIDTTTPIDRSRFTIPSTFKLQERPKLPPFAR